MTAPLARYAGPLAAWRGAIGRAVDGGVMLAGRVRHGRAERPSYVLQPSGVTWDSWRRAADALAAWLEPRDENAARFVRASVESVEGLSVVVDGVEYRLTVE